MSWATLEKAVLNGARKLFNNPKLKMKDIEEWSTGGVEERAGEVSAYIKDPGVYVSIKVELDKR